MEFDVEKMSKALAECHGGRCFDGCYLFDTAIKDEQMRCMNCLNIANEVIKKLTEENTELKATNKILTHDNKNLEKAYYDLACEVEDLRNENENLHATCSELAQSCTALDEENERLRNSTVDYRNIPYIRAEAKADTVREFAERVSSCFCPDCDYSGYEIREVIDQITKEM